MSHATFLCALMVGAALLALWVHARFPALAPDRLGRTMLHAAVAYMVLRFTIDMFDATASTFASIFFLLLPALVYALLSMLWVLRLAQTALGLSR
jgi:hypothetical protein